MIVGADVAHRSNALGEIEVGGVVKIGERNGIRGQTENQDGRQDSPCGRW